MTTSSQMDWEDVRPDTLRVAAVADGRGAVQVYTVSSPRDGDRWPGHLAELLEYGAGGSVRSHQANLDGEGPPAAVADGRPRGHHALALDQATARTLGLPFDEPDTARPAPWPVGIAVLDVLRALHDGAQLTETRAGTVLIARDDTRQPVPARTWDHLFRIEAVEQDPRGGTCRLTGYGRKLVTDPRMLRFANGTRVEPCRSSRAQREQIVFGDRASAAAPPEHPNEGYMVAVRHGHPPCDELLGRTIGNGDVLELKLAGEERPEWRRVEYRIDRPRDCRVRRQVAWLDLGRDVRFYLWRERMVLRWPREPSS